MKPATLLLAATLLCNAVLVAVILFNRPTTPSAAQASGNTQNATPAQSLAQLLASPDTRAIIDRLRDEGFPPSMIRSIATLRLNKEFAERRAALINPTPYWRNSYYPSGEARQDPKLLAERRALEDEYRAALKELTGGMPGERSAYERRAYGTLSDDKVAKIQAVSNDYATLRMQLQAEMKGVTFPDDKSQLELLEKEQRADLEKILTPAELRDYDLRSSPAARTVRNQLRFFSPSEAEYAALYDVQAAIDQHTANANLTADELRTLRESQIKTALPPERYEEYRIKTSGSYETVQTLVERLSLPAQTTNAVVGLQVTVVDQSALIRADTSLTSEQRDAQLAALAQESTNKLKTSLGEEGFNNYSKTAAAGWLQKLTPKPTR